MITLKVKGSKEKYSIPSKWSDLTYKQWIGIKSTDDETEIMAILSGLPIDSIERMSEKSAFNISKALSFIGVKFDIDKYEVPNKLTVSIKGKLLTKDVEIDLIEDIKVHSFGQKIMLQRIIEQNQEDIFKGIIDIILVYAQPIIDGSKCEPDRFDALRPSFESLKLVDLYSTARNYIVQLEEIVKIESVELDNPPTSEQTRAGIAMFDKYGIMNTIRGMAQNDILKYDAVLEIEYNIAFIHMSMSCTQNKFSDNYRKVLNAK